MRTDPNVAVLNLHSLSRILAVFAAAGIAAAAAVGCATSQPAAPAVKSAAATPNASPSTSTSANASAAALRGLDPADMDRSVAACANFYEYANGGWLKNNPIPADQARWGGSDALRERNLADLHQILDKLVAASPSSAPAGSDERKLADFYGSCMDLPAIEAQGIKPLQSDFARIDAIHDLPSLQTEIARLQALGVNALFTFGPEEDRKDSSRMVAAALQGGLSLPDVDYYTKTDAKSQELRQKFVAHVAKMLELAGDSPEKASRSAVLVLAFETKLAEASMGPVERRDPDETYHPMTRQAFEAMTPHLFWAAFFRQEHVADGPMNVWQPKFFTAADALLVSEPLSTWKTLLRWHLLDAAASSLSQKFYDEDFEFNSRTLRGVPEKQPRWRKCVQDTDNAIGMALGRIYVKEYFPPEAKERADRLVKNLLAALRDDLDQLPWMGPQTKKAALAKLDTFDPKIGYPSQWRDYSSLQISRTSYAVNSFAAGLFEFDRQMAKIGKPVDRTEWGITPPTVNAYYYPPKNEIVFPAGILQPPFFYAEGDDAINYGGIGAVIGHEITHGFDNLGRKYDARGNLVDWWTAADQKSFEERSNCIVKEFDAFVVDGDLHENGKLVQGESIADLGGLTIAYRAYHKELEGKPAPAPIDGLTGDQRFFVSFARIWASNHRPEFARLIATTNEHPLGEFRVTGSVSNMPEFSRAFGCGTTSPMVRLQLCDIW